MRVDLKRRGEEKGRRGEPNEDEEEKLATRPTMLNHMIMTVTTKGPIVATLQDFWQIFQILTQGAMPMPFVACVTRTNFWKTCSTQPVVAFGTTVLSLVLPPCP